MSAETYAKVVAARAARPDPFPPRDLRQCQDRLARVDALLADWLALGKADGAHGGQLRAVLHPEEGHEAQAQG